MAVVEDRRASRHHRSAKASPEPSPQPRGEDDRPSNRGAREHEIATNEAKLESTQEKKGNKVTSKDECHGNDERTQSARVGEGGVPTKDMGWREDRKDVTTNLTNLTNRSDGGTREAAFPRATPGTGEPQRMS